VTSGSHPLPGTVGETAAEVGRRGGTGIAVQVDHAQDEQVEALFEQVRREQGRLDLLVDNAFALPDTLTEPEPFWDKPLSYWEMVDVGVRSNHVAAGHAARIMVQQQSGLIAAPSAKDSKIIQRSGGPFITDELTQQYGVTDIDGRVPPSLRAQRGSPIYSPVWRAGANAVNLLNCQVGGK
jgi:NAD(P)-dependent dehydrogenase (short-subunit alcohol dehydrogenase family)